ncbi:MAG: hypothetical protein JXA54_02705 [Candidatus Heimdallarchaeota archaeon]|nr:hypothetical protein [Candidatus Heimdallarchaeota archaeon]
MTKLESLYRRDGNKILFDGVDLEKDISDIHGTPTYVFSERRIKENITHLKTTFKNHYPETTIAYSMKNNSLLEVNSIIANHLSNFEITSFSELKLLEQLSYEKEKGLNIISTNVFKSDELLEAIVNYPDFDLEKVSQKDLYRFIAVDSYQDFKNVERIASKYKQKLKILVRVNPGITMDIDKTVFASANISAKCASIITDIQSIKESSNDLSIPIWLPERDTNPSYDSAERLLKEVYESKYLDLYGIHCHLGSQITNIDYFDRFFEVVTQFFKLMNEKYEEKLKILDFGGGYPVEYFENDSVPTIDSIAKSLAKKIKNAKIAPNIIIESGRFITASAGMLLTKVNLTKENSSGRKIAVLDLSVYSDLLDILTANWYYECYLVNKLPQVEDEQKVTNWELVGGTNDILDRLNPRMRLCPNCSKLIPSEFERIFPRELVVGDLLAIKNTGAYTTCFNSNYSGKPFPEKVIIPDE